MPEKVEESEDASFLDSLLILEGESNYAPWLHFLISYIGPEYWKILRGDGRKASHLDKLEHTVDPRLAAPRLDGAGSPQLYDEEENKSSKALSYLRATLNDEARNLIKEIDSPSEAFNKVKLFYGKPRHQTMALRWSKWASLRYKPGDSESEFIRRFGERLQDVEEIGDILDHKTVFAQFVHAISKDGGYPDFILQMSPDLEDRNLMEAVCDTFIRHENSFTYATPAPASANSKPLHQAGTIKREINGFQYCPFHNRVVKHTPAEYRLGQTLKPKARIDITQMFGGTRNPNKKRRRPDSCDGPKWIPTFYSGP